MPLKTLGSRRLVRQTALGLRVQHDLRSQIFRSSRKQLASQQRREVLRSVHLGQVMQKH